MEKTIISWTLNDYCKAQCEYCPTHSKGGGQPPEISEYIRIANLLIDSYKVKQGRNIEWIFNGGEPFDMDYMPSFLKLCKEHGDSVTLHTSGGRLWIDWWAVEPHVDNLVLTFHHWQNPALIKYIVDTFKSKGKGFSLSAPIRHTNVQEDIDRVLELEDQLGMLITKTQLYFNADPSAGMLKYSWEDLQKIDFFNLTKEGRVRALEEKARRIEEQKKREEERLRRLAEQPPQPVPAPPPPPPPPPPVEKSPLVEEVIYFQETTWDQRYEDSYNQHPSYAGQMCNAGVEKLVIGAQGWVAGSNCNNIPLGNIWHPGWMPPQGPQKCGMKACVDASDQLITKFPLNDL
jgi:organic radical activating enzyme